MPSNKQSDRPAQNAAAMTPVPLDSSSRSLCLCEQIRLGIAIVNQYIAFETRRTGSWSARKTHGGS
jgi:hypothetical protein